MKIGILITHPTQFDVPVFRLGKEYIHVIYTDRKRVEAIYDPELKRTVSWEENNLDGYHFETVPGKRPLRWLFSKLKKENYDLLITNGYYTKYFIFALIAGKFLCKRNAIRVDTVEYNSSGRVNKIYKRLLYAFLKLFVDRFFIVSTLSRNFLLKQGIKPGKIALYGYISDNDFFAAASNKARDKQESIKKQFGIIGEKKIVLCVSKHNDREAPFDTLAAFRQLNNNGLHLLLIGDGPMHEEVKNKARDLQIVNITFAGYVPFIRLPEFYAIADIFVHDSHNEPWGVSVQEAMACNVPVIASDKVGASFDLIVEGENGYISEAGNSHDLAVKMDKGLKLDKHILTTTNSRILQQWNFQISLDNIIRSAN